MKNETKFKISFLLSIVIIFISIFMYFQKSPYWFFSLTIGAFLFFNYLSHLRGNKSTLDLIFDKNYKTFFKVFLAIFILGFFIEVIGMIFFDLWAYSLADYIPEFLTMFNFAIKNPFLFTSFLLYPIVLMSYREMYEYINTFFKNNIISIIISMIVGIIIWEVPNVFSKDWIYTIPYITFEIVGINILVIFGWAILIYFPVYVYNKLEIKSSSK